jgi:hypothetical protein
MNAFHLPEIYLNRKSEMKLSRLLVGLFIVNLVCATSTLAVWAAQGGNFAAKLFGVLWFFQMIILGSIGIQRLSTAISSEKVHRTWDFARLTPLSAWQVSLGKFLGRPLYGYYLAALFIPWFVGCSFFFDAASLVKFGWVLFQSYTLMYFLLAGSLLASASSEERFADRSLSTTLVGVFSLSVLFGTRLFSNVGQSLLYYDHSVAKPLVWALSFAAFGTWALFATKWQIGASLLEKPRFYRAPLFLFFVYVYLCGFATQSHDFEWSLGVVCLLSYSIVFFSVHDDGDAFRRWVRESSFRIRLDRTPSWILNFAVLLVLSFVSFGLMHAEPTRYAYAALALPLFALRDFAIVQLCRDSRSRRPGIFAFVLLILMYGVPLSLLAGFRRTDLYFLFLPNDNNAIELLAPLVQAAALSVLYLSKTLPRPRRRAA